MLDVSVLFVLFIPHEKRIFYVPHNAVACGLCGCATSSHIILQT